jgi:hypothetical protein
MPRRALIILVCSSLAVACGADSTAATPDAAAPDSSLDGASAFDAPARDSDVDACVQLPPPNYPFNPPTYIPATGAHQGACSAMQIAEFYSDCVALGTTTASCAPYRGSTAPSANKACAACLLTSATDVKWGPLVIANGTTSVNVAGCMELLDPGAGLTCAKSYQAALICEQTACSNLCPSENPAGIPYGPECEQVAAMYGCKTWADASDACAAAEADGGAAAFCLQAQTFEDFYANIAPLFCGAPIGDAAAD